MSTYPAATLERARQVVASLRIFAALPAEASQALAKLMIPHEYAAGQVICLEGDPGDYVYVLEKGWIKVVRAAVDGREQIAMLLHDGELFGVEAAFGGAAYPVTVIALEEVTAWSIERGALLSLVNRCPALALACLKHLSEQVLYYLQLVEDLGLRSVQARIAHTLMNHAELRNGQLVVSRRAWATQDEMASRLGTVRDVINRSLKALEVDGILQIERNQIIILDAQKLVERGRAAK